MSKCSVNFVPVLFAGVVAGTNLVTVTDLRAQTTEQATERAAEAPMQIAQVADSCLSAPSGATPAGSHWYYRIDRVTKRQCWYMREESEKADDKFARAAPPESAPATPPTADASRTRKFSEARAEYVAQPPRAEPIRAETRSIAAAPTPAVLNNQRAAMPNVLSSAPLSSMRWNEAPTASASANPAPIQVAATAAAPVEQQQAQVDYAQQPTAEQIAAVAVEPAKPPTASLQKLLLVMAAALALAGLTVSAIVRIGRMRARRAMRRKRRAMWDSARVKKRAPQPMYHDEDAKLRRAAGMQPAPARAPRDHAFQDQGFQDRGFQGRGFQDRPFQDPPAQDRALQERTRVPRERQRAAPESYAPANRRPAPQGREREQQVTEMLARLARSAQT